MSGEERRLFDPGLQPERTLLAWRRTTLSVGVVGAVGVRVTAGELGWPAVVLGIAVLALSLVAYLGAGWHYRRVHSHLLAHNLHPADGRAQAFLTAATLLCGLTASAFLASRI